MKTALQKDFTDRFLSLVWLYNYAWKMRSKKARFRVALYEIIVSHCHTKTVIIPDFLLLRLVMTIRMRDTG